MGFSAHCGVFLLRRGLSGWWVIDSCPFLALVGFACVYPVVLLGCFIGLLAYLAVAGLY